MKNNLLNNKKPGIRFLNEMQPVLCDQEWFTKIKKTEKFAVYYVYRGLKKKGDLRYDITVIPAKMFGKEFPKTKGHHHFEIPELIQVLEGKAFYFFQKGTGASIKEAYAVKASKGDVVIVPTGYDHLTINPGKKRLVMANWIFNKTENDYSFFDRFQGACYYYTKNGWVRNKKYKKIPKLEIKKPQSKSMPKNLDFLEKN
ncbi:MAG: glucose-6-phosphate isomerase family protein [Candidatus Paceibacterota bacterium]